MAGKKGRSGRPPKNITNKNRELHNYSSAYLYNRMLELPDGEYKDELARFAVGKFGVSTIKNDVEVSAKEYTKEQQDYLSVLLHNRTNGIDIN